MGGRITLCPIEIINNTRGGIESEIVERDYWGGGGRRFRARTYYCSPLATIVALFGTIVEVILEISFRDCRIVLREL